MPFQGNRIFLIAIGLALVVIIILAAAAASSAGQSHKNPAGLITCTVNGDIGIDKVVITNQNTGKSITKTYADLPYSFNLTEGDTIKLTVSLTDGYLWNAWEINQYPWFAQDNPFTMRVNEVVVLNPQCLAK